MVDDTRTRLLNAAQALVQRVGANAMSYQHLSDEVGIRKASIHHHFPAKSDLLAALIDRYRNDFSCLLDRIDADEADGASKLRRFCGVFEATLRDDACDKACPCGMLGAEIVTLAPQAAQRLRVFYRLVNRRVAGFLRDGRRDGTLVFAGDPAVVAFMLFSLLEGAMLVARVEGGVAAFRSVVKQFLSWVSAAPRP